VASLARAVAGDLATVATIVPPGSDPEAFEARPRDLLRLRGADLLVRVGLGLDFWVDNLAAQLGNPDLLRGGARSVDCSQGIPLLEVRGRSVVPEDGHAHGAANPHYWLDPANAATMTAAIVEGIVRIAPDLALQVEDNRGRFLMALNARMARWQSQLAPAAGAAVIAYHNSWPYFARRFRLDVVDFVEPKEGVAPSPAHLASLLGAAREHGVRAILQESYEPQDQSRLLAEKLDVPLVLLAPGVGGVPEAGDYLALFDYDVAALTRALAPEAR
jgi:ABC-type Zn uptake system ZnuABC Zn-binding protein ZnuA